jgi:hypothetical protein
MTMRTVKVREKASFLITESLKINRKHASIWLQNPSDFMGTLAPGFLGQVVKHHRAEREVELTVGKWQSLGQTISKENFYAGLSRLLLRPAEHFR